MPAKNLKAPRGIRIDALSLTTIASKPAPTEGCGVHIDVGAAEGCDLLILFLKNQKIAAFG
ncbi:MAG: hypothetical protein ACRESJ_02565, partial [Pseudomonas sp.]